MRAGIEGEGGRTRLGNAVGGTRAREHRASEEIQHEMRLMHRTYWSHRRLLTWSRHAGRWRPLRNRKVATSFCKRASDDWDGNETSFNGCGCMHTPAAAPPDQCHQCGSADHKRQLREASGAGRQRRPRRGPPLAMLMLAGSLGPLTLYCQTGSNFEKFELSSFKSPSNKLKSTIFLFYLFKNGGAN